MELHLEPNLGRVDSALIQFARERAHDLLVVGSHQRQGFQRLWQTSVSRGVLHHAPMGVAVVPHSQQTGDGGRETGDGRRENEAEFSPADAP